MELTFFSFSVELVLDQSLQYSSNMLNMFVEGVGINVRMSSMYKMTHRLSMSWKTSLKNDWNMEGLLANPNNNEITRVSL